MWIFYQLLVALAFVVAGPVLLATRGKHYLATLPGRLGAYDGSTPQSPIWLHAVSVGEVGVAATLARALPPELPLLVTTITPTGQERALKAFAERIAQGTAAVTYLPFELGWVIRRFLRRFSPRALVLVEGDLWPLLLHKTRGRGIPIVVVNGRIGDRSFRRMRRMRPLLDPLLRPVLLRPVERWGTQTQEDRRRLLELGVDFERIVVTGNLKFETPTPVEPPGLLDALREAAGGRPILVAGSTMAGEESLVLEAFTDIGRGDRALLVLAPRHPERWGEVERRLREGGYATLLRSRMTGPARPEVVLLDTLGELASVYAVGAGAFIGGTLVPTGGHNPLEPAGFGVPIVVGPSMENFREIAAIFDGDRAWRRVADTTELAAAWDRWLEKPDEGADIGSRAKALMAAHRGSLERTLELLEPMLARQPGSNPP